MLDTRYIHLTYYERTLNKNLERLTKESPMASLTLSQPTIDSDTASSTSASSKWSISATCMRCGGLMVGHLCVDLLNTSHELEFAALRCIQCGDIVDPVILYHRQQSQNRPSIEPCQTRPASVDGDPRVAI